MDKTADPNIIENADGSVTVKFDDRPLKIDGTAVKSLNMREPTVNDQLVARKSGLGDEEAEVNMIANLCELPPDAVRGMTMRQYVRLQEALAGFMS